MAHHVVNHKVTRFAVKNFDRKCISIATQYHKNFPSVAAGDEASGPMATLGQPRKGKVSLGTYRG